MEAPVNDSISRQAVIRWVKTECNPYGKPTIDFESGKKVIEHLEQMPPAHPEQKTGKWVNDGKGLYKCTACGELWLHWWATVVPIERMYKEMRFCPHCGAKMNEKETADEEK